jgi:hypothetical protein
MSPKSPLISNFTLYKKKARTGIRAFFFVLRDQVNYQP